MPPQGNPRAIVEASLDIAASPPVLWATFTDMNKWPRWSPTVQSACCVAGTEWTLGAQFELALDLPFPVRHWSGIATITEVQPATFVSWEKEYPLNVAVVHSYRFRPSELGTLFIIREAYYGNGVLLYRLSGFPGQMRRAFEAALKKLKVYLEVGG
jgi:uncharacterized protein YndB with AHSA1/START domain